MRFVLGVFFLGLENSITTALLSKIGADLSEAESEGVLSPTRLLRFGATSSPEKSGKPWAQAGVLLTHHQSRSRPLSNLPYSEDETLFFLVRVDFKDLSSEAAALDLVSIIKNSIRGFLPVRGAITQPFGIDRTTLKGLEDGIWQWEIIATVGLIRRQDEEFLPIEPPEDFELENITLGLWRSPQGEVGVLDSSVFDSEIDVPQDEG